MTVTLPTTDLVDTPEWSIRPEQPIDLDLIHDLHREAFHRRDEAELVDAIRSGPDFLPELSLVAATRDGSVLGHILISRVSFHPDGDEQAGHTVLALAPLAVLPPYQGHGIGSALMRDAKEIPAEVLDEVDRAAEERSKKAQAARDKREATKAKKRH